MFAPNSKSFADSITPPIDSSGVGSKSGLLVGFTVGIEASPFEPTFPAYFQTDEESFRCKAGRTATALSSRLVPSPVAQHQPYVLISATNQGLIPGDLNHHHPFFSYSSSSDAAPQFSA